MATESSANGGSHVDALKDSKCYPRKLYYNSPVMTGWFSRRAIDNGAIDNYPLTQPIHHTNVPIRPRLFLSADPEFCTGQIAAEMKNQVDKTGAEFSNVADARRAHGRPAANGQPLTHYHSLFSELLSWNNPRASAVTYVSIVTLILSIRYLDVIRYFFKLTWMVLGVTVLAEVAGRAVLGHGLATQFRPRKYYTISRETLHTMVGDVNELVNFFVIEAQRILFAENVAVSGAAAAGAFLSYLLAGVIPYWGLALIGTTVVFLAPLIYITNKELIDHYVQEGSDALSSQTEELRQVASKHASQATEITKQYMGDYTAKAQMILHRGRSASPEAATKPAPQSDIRETDFPEAPKEDLKSADSEHEAAGEPLAA